MSQPAVPELPIVIRDVRPSDLALVSSSWKKSLRSSSPALSDGAYFRLMNAVAEEVLSGAPTIRVACSPVDDDVILGWLCASATDAGIVLWAGYTVAAYRRQRVAKRLLADVLGALDREAGPGLFYCSPSRFDAAVERNGAAFVSYSKALHMRAQRAA